MTYVAVYHSGRRICVETIDGKTIVKPGSFSYLDTVPPIHFLMYLSRFPRNCLNVSVFIVVFIAGGLFHVLEKTGALEAGIGVSVEKLVWNTKTL